MSNLETSRAERLDNYVARQFVDLSRAFAARLVQDGKVQVNGTPQTKPGYKLRPDDTVVIDYNPADQPPVPSITLPVLYEDDDCVVISKPAGVLTHSKGAPITEATVATWLRGRLQGMAGERAGIVHRLDRATSGVLICAKNQAALSWLQKQFALRKVKKTYYAVIEGELAEPHAIIDLPIERNPKLPQTFRVGANGKPSTTEYQITATGLGHSLIELKPLTGRTHQLRVHLAYLKHPILGDKLYGGNEAVRLYLHAAALEITLPNRQRMVFESALPADFKEQVGRA